jgi:hypothetical protein
MHTEFSAGNLKERDCLEDLGIDVRIILKQVFRKLGEGVDCIHFAQDMEQ